MNRRDLIRSGLIAIGCAAVFPRAGAAAAPLEVTYYYLPT